MRNHINTNNKLSLIGSISLGTGAMIGAGIFVLMGQIAELVGDLFPIAFIAGAIVVCFSSYSYVKFSNAFPSSGGVEKFLNKSYGPGTITGVFSLLMYVSMVVSQSLVAGTFGAYTLRLFPERFATYASILGVFLLVIVFIVNILGNKVIETTATFTAIIKVLGIALLAIAGLLISGFADITGNYIPKNAEELPIGIGFVASLALAILAYKGFTTITNQGGDIDNPHKNLGRSIIASILICTVIYVALALAVAGGLSIPEIIKAKDYALAAAAEPVFGKWGIWITVAIAIVATFSGVIASVFSSSRLLGMLSTMKQVPSLKKLGNFKNPALIFTVSLAILLTISFDLTRIASIGVIFYLIMDIAIHWGLFRHLKKEVDFLPIIPLMAIVMDVVVLSAFLYVKYISDPLVLFVATIGIILMIASERFFMNSHTDEDGDMQMGMETNNK
ncbi:APC family permease [Flavobacterium sp. TAB 87]|uniref:APC family permease n=1 Tax=Flavobacterium sp. TAB 87 TaxID=1729581 RepID=UPI00076D07E8|nr:APC family permease [Flavobacterium sp. TAB 87]KVV16294.1 Inner membrane transport protein YbaT [Flavobacterium sp. TAB 87]